MIHFGQIVIVSRQPEDRNGIYARCCGLFHARPISQPALLLGGADDLLCSPAFVKKRAEQMGARVEIVADAGHFAHLEKPTETISTIERFLTFV